MKAIGLIPVRLESKRLPGKALLDLDGLPMIIHTAKRALLAKELDQVYVCTDSNKIINVCKKFKVKFIKTSLILKN
jgi:3-deoxy-manno-octulosonate cytidylyltransferase (CMP-KDO synthetase)